MSRSILLVDDEPAILKTLTAVFSQRGWTTFNAPEGAAAIRIYDEEQPNVVLLDVNMPGLRGTEVLRLILARDPDAAVVMLTGAGDIATSVEAMQIGAENFLAKPPDLAQLLA